MWLPLERVPRSALAIFQASKASASLSQAASYRFALASQADPERWAPVWTSSWITSCLLGVVVEEGLKIMPPGDTRRERVRSQYLLELSVDERANIIPDMDS